MDKTRRKCVKHFLAGLSPSDNIDTPRPILLNYQIVRGTRDRMLEKDLTGTALFPEEIEKNKKALISQHPSKVFWGINDKLTMKRNMS
jgi:hypothetical protein